MILWNVFLQPIDVMDCSLLVIVDEEHCEIILAVIDFVRKYTWDKHLETSEEIFSILGVLKNI